MILVPFFHPGFTTISFSAAICCIVPEPSTARFDVIRIRFVVPVYRSSNVTNRVWLTGGALVFAGAIGPREPPFIPIPAGIPPGIPPEERGRIKGGGGGGCKKEEEGEEEEEEEEEEERG